ncbi:META domain-containing protein [Flavobacterium chungangense]|uniref:META domain-containing protein n=1 Tax=Flavobacterium chungangense TaxID=554283 RepID=A0A6V6Z377_9FLAO|nr:META domain-containing protein [Flavobacterium chungangense]CAD0005382.1 META domain-containing protein [Flavobacterium chungangense]
MIKNIFILFFFGFLLISCNVFKCKKKDVLSKLEGNWELSYITGPRIAFEGLYPNKKPSINFNTKENLVSGNNSCNSYTGQLNVSENKINFKEPMVTTKMMCIDGQGEQVFMSTLSKVTSYNVTDDGRTLNFISGNIETMRFTKR